MSKKRTHKASSYCTLLSGCWIQDEIVHISEDLFFLVTVSSQISGYYYLFRLNSLKLTVLDGSHTLITAYFL